MNVSMMTKLLAGVNHECAMCHETKFLEYLLMDEEHRSFNICEACRDRLLSSVPMKKIEPQLLWVSQAGA